MPLFFQLLSADIRAKSDWLYGDTRVRSLAKTLLTDGTFAMVVYRCMQWSRRWRLFPLELFFNKVNAVLGQCVLGRGTEFGPGFVLVHSQGVVINGQVTGGRGVIIEHRVTIGAEKLATPRLGDDIFVGAGAKIIGDLAIGDGARVGANAVVVDDVPQGATVVGVPARVVRMRGAGSGR